MGNKQSIARIVFAAASVAVVSAELVVNYGRNGDYDLPASWDCSPNWDHNLTYTTEDCCVASCMSSMLHHEENSYKVCVADGMGGVEADSQFEWSDHYCDCAVKDYCKFACHPTCDTPLVSRYNTPKLWNNFAMRASVNNQSKTVDDVYSISLRHDSRNLCPVFFFAIYRTPNQIVIDWSQSVLYKPWSFDGSYEYSCEKIIVEFSDNEDYPVCGKFGDGIFGSNPVKCGLRLPSRLIGEAGINSELMPGSICDTVAEYVAYSSCEFKGISVFKPVCETPEW